MGGARPRAVRRLRDYAVGTWGAMAGDAVRGGIEVRVLGAFEVSVEGRPVVVPRGRVRALLASLALSAGRPVAVDALVDRLWSAATPLSARQSLQNTVWRLRRLLGEDAVVGEALAYRLDIDRDAVDALWFTKLLEQPPARDRLAEALRLWRGEPLSGVDSESLRRDWAPLLTERYLAALEQRIDLDLAAGDPGALVAELQGLTAQHPLRESLWVRLMTALAGSGRGAEALQAYERARRALADSLGADPCLELRELHRRILVGEPIGTPPAAESGAGPEAAGTVPRQMPSEIAGFVGRADRLAELDHLLDGRADRSVLTVVVHGVGGVGKTALAVRWAHRVADRFPQGQLYLNLQGYGPEEPIPAVQALGSLLRAVDVAPREIPDQLGERSALWRTTTAGRQLLILLDNARDADQVRPLLPGSDSVVVVTSRNQLRGLSARDGARSLQLHEMTDVEARTVLAHAAGADRVPREADVAGGLIALCGGLPLALRITAELAARSLGASLSDLAAELRAQRLETLADPDDDAADPRAVFSWSYRALGPAEARVFRLLSMHPGADFSLPAAAAVIGEPIPRARRTLSRLVAVHLLEQSGHRYRFHDLVREYAAECATADSSAAERDAGTRRVLDWYLTTASNARNALKLAATNSVMEPADPVVAPLQFADQQQGLTWFHTEASALLAATRYAADHGYPAHAEQLSGALHGWHELTQRLDEWLTVAELGYRSARSLDTRARYRAAHTMGVVLSYRDLLDDAEAYKQEALRHARALNDPKPVVTALIGLGVLHQRRGAGHAALEHWHEAMRTADEHDLRFQVAQCLLNIGGEEANNGLLEDGIRHSEEALALYRALGADFHQGLVLSNLADNHARAGRLDRAVECCDEAIALFKQADAAPPIAFGIEMGAVYVKAGQHRKARLVLQPIADSLRGQTHPLLAEVQRLLSDADRAETGPLTSRP